MKKIFSVLLIFTVISCCLYVFFFNEKSESEPKFEIKSEDIDNRLLYNEVSNNINRIYLTSLFCDTEIIEQYQKIVLSEDRELLKKELEKDLMICYLCEQKGILINRQSAEKKAETEYNNLKTEDNQNRYYETLLNVLDEYRISEEEYIDLLYEQAYYKYNRISLKNDFKENQYDENSDKTLDEQFEDYLSDKFKQYFIYVSH